MRRRPRAGSKPTVAGVSGGECLRAGSGRREYAAAAAGGERKDAAVRPIAPTVTDPFGVPPLLVTVTSIAIPSAHHGRIGIVGRGRRRDERTYCLGGAGGIGAGKVGVAPVTGDSRVRSPGVLSVRHRQPPATEPMQLSTPSLMVTLPVGLDTADVTV